MTSELIAKSNKANAKRANDYLVKRGIVVNCTNDKAQIKSMESFIFGCDSSYKKIIVK